MDKNNFLNSGWIKPLALGDEVAAYYGRDVRSRTFGRFVKASCDTPLTWRGRSGGKGEKNAGNSKRVISIGLFLALAFSLLPQKNEEIKVSISQMISIIWLIYAIYHKDYLVMFVCIFILLTTFNFVKLPT